MNPRPEYETAGDRGAEQAVAAKLAIRRGQTYRKMPRRYAVDYALLRVDAIASWAEIKCRSNPMAAYPTYMLSFAKYEGMLQLQSSSGLPVELVVQWADVLGILRIPCQLTLGFGGRADRGDEQDSEPVVFFPTDQFRTIHRRQE